MHHVGVAVVDRLAGWIAEVLAHHMLESTSETVVVTNGDDRIVLVSRSGQALGWSRTVLIGQRWDEIEDVPPAADAGGTPSPAGMTERRTTSVRRGDGAWEPVHLVRYVAHLPEVGPASVLVLTPVRDAA